MRKHYIDNLRSILILILIPYHAAMAWNVWEEPNYIFFDGNRIISSIVVFFSPFFMAALFMLAGISTCFALKKKTFWQYLSERFRKLIIPFLLGTLILMPPITYIADKFNTGYSGNFLRHYTVFFTKFTDLTGADGGFSVGHFWFLLYLFIISLAGIGIIAVQKRIKSEQAKNIPMWLICMAGLPLPLLSNLLSVGGKSLAEYLYLFLLGYYFFSEESIIRKTERYKWIFLCIGLSATVLNVYLFLWSNTKYPIINSAAKYTAEWFMLLTLIGIGKGFLNFKTELTSYLSKISFRFYIYHYIWLVMFQYLIFRLFNENTLLLYAVPVFLSYIATFICCEASRKISSCKSGKRSVGN